MWDYPRPPVLVPSSELVEVWHGEVCVASTRNSLRLLETASPPTFYLPPGDIELSLLAPATGASFCEWKGAASYWSLKDRQALGAVGWSYEHPSAAYAAIAGHLSFYPAKMLCRVAGEHVRPQPGGFYGGWITDAIAGPVKGEPGTGGW